MSSDLDEIFGAPPDQPLSDTEVPSAKVLGTSRKQFYGADSSSSEEDLDDYQEAIRLQKLRA